MSSYLIRTSKGEFRKIRDTGLFQTIRFGSLKVRFHTFCAATHNTLPSLFILIRLRELRGLESTSLKGKSLYLLRKLNLLRCKIARAFRILIRAILLPTLLPQLPYLIYLLTILHLHMKVDPCMIIRFTEGKAM